METKIKKIEIDFEKEKIYVKGLIEFDEIEELKFFLDNVINDSSDFIFEINNEA